MPLTAKHKEFIANSVEHLFSIESEELPAFISGCRDSLNEAFAREPSTAIRPASSTESSTLYQIFLCATQPETQLKGLEKQHASKATIFEAQDYFLFYAVCRLQYQLANPTADSFDIDAWLAAFILPDETPPASNSAWFTRTDANNTFAEFKWDTQDTQKRLDLLKEKNNLPFITRSPDNQGAGNYDWSLPMPGGRIFDAHIDETEQQLLDEDGAPFIDLAINLTITVYLPTNTINLRRENFTLYPIDDDARNLLKHRTVWMVKNYAIKKAFFYLNELTDSNLEYDKTRYGLQLLAYQHYIDAIIHGRLSLAFIYTLTKEETTTLRNEAVIKILKAPGTPIDVAKTLRPHTQNLLVISHYSEKVCSGKVPLTRLATISAEQCRIMVRPPIVNLQIIGKIPFDIAETMSGETADVLSNDFYYESVRDGKISLITLHPLTPKEKNNLLDEDVIALIKHGVTTVGRAKQLSSAAMRLVKNTFYFYLFTQKFLDENDLLNVTNEKAAALCENHELEEMLQKLTAVTKTRPNPQEELVRLRVLLTLTMLQKKLLSTVKIDAFAPGLMLFTEKYYIAQTEKRDISLDFIKHLKKNQATTLLHPAVIMLHKHDCGDIESLKNLTLQEIALIETDIYQQRLLQHKTSLLSFLAIRKENKKILLLPNIIRLQHLGKLSFEIASKTTYYTGLVLSDKFYYDAVVSNAIPVTALLDLNQTEQENLLDLDIKQPLQAGAISIETAKNPSNAAMKLLKNKFYFRHIESRRFPDNFLANVTEAEANYLLKIETIQLIISGALTPATATTLSEADRQKLSVGKRVYQLFADKALSLLALNLLSSEEAKQIEADTELYYRLAQNCPETPAHEIIQAYAKECRQASAPNPAATPMPGTALIPSIPVNSQQEEIKALPPNQVNYFLKISLLEIQKNISSDISLNARRLQMPVYIFISQQISKAQESSKENKDNQVWREAFDAISKRLGTPNPDDRAEISMFDRRNKQKLDALRIHIANIAESLGKFDQAAIAQFSSSSTHHPPEGRYTFGK